MYKYSKPINKPNRKAVSMTVKWTGALALLAMTGGLACAAWVSGQSTNVVDITAEQTSLASADLAGQTLHQASVTTQRPAQRAAKVDLTAADFLNNSGDPANLEIQREQMLRALAQDTQKSDDDDMKPIGGTAAAGGGTAALGGGSSAGAGAGSGAAAASVGVAAGAGAIAGGVAASSSSSSSSDPAPVSPAIPTF